MKRRLKIYFIHSSKMDYNNLLYRQILASEVCLKHELILPQSKNYRDKYVKDLINKADLIIAEVSTLGFGLKLELKWALKSGKPVKYISLNNDVPKKLRKLVSEIELINEDKPFIKIIEDFISYYANQSIEDLSDTTIVLGEIEKK
ncbi:MAG: hypothetical protein PHG03_04695 [Bacilli bacterium]|nr:hypothetical protein [Bacilli bacterium]MDD4795833.1 hypothetical protein [Bacilli bacterium]